ncbi:MAG: sensor histidine kinase, partial [Spirochaetota bacterium]
AEEKLKTTLVEKENLMQELNHRVKNNLYIISSLIHLKDTALGEQADLEDIKHQVDAIQIVHNKLTYTADYKNINIHDYLQDLVRTFFASYSSLRVDLNIDIENIELPTKKAVPLGLITNEIATNAVKHGFIEGAPAWFSTALSTDHENQQYVYTSANSGNPFPDDIDFDTTTTLGMRLIKGLLTQIDATIELQRKPSPLFTIRFPV